MASGLLGEGATSSTVDVGAFLDSDIGKLIARLVSMGVLVSIGSTRDRGAVSLTVTHDGNWDREYFRDSFDACEWLSRAVEILAGRGLTEIVPEAPAVQKRTRARQKLA